MKPRRPRRTKTRIDAVAAGYRSGFEKAVADDLTKRGIEFKYESEKFKYVRPVRGGLCSTCNGKSVGRTAHYTPDFVVSGNLYIECKGRLTSSDRTKLVAFRSEHPEIDLRLLFATDNWCTKLHKQRYSEWATKQGFTHAVGRAVPEEWVG